MFELLFGDALQRLRDIPTGSVDAIITDPPYSSGAMVRSDRMRPVTEKYSSAALPPPGFSGDNRDARSWGYWMALWIGEARRVLRSGGYFLTFSDWRQLPICTDVVQAGGIVWRGVIVWDKTLGCRPQPGCFRNQAEYIVWGTSGPVQKGVGPWPGVMRYSVQSEKRYHLTGKPVQLMRELVQCVPVGGVVLDPFAGSGSTGVACLETGRVFIGIEADRHYYGVAEERLRQAVSSQTACQKISN